MIVYSLHQWDVLYSYMVPNIKSLFFIISKPLTLCYIISCIMAATNHDMEAEKGKLFSLISHKKIENGKPLQYLIKYLTTLQLPLFIRTTL